MRLKGDNEGVSTMPHKAAEGGGLAPRPSPHTPLPRPRPRRPSQHPQAQNRWCRRPPGTRRAAAAPAHGGSAAAWAGSLPARTHPCIGGARRCTVGLRHRTKVPRHKRRGGWVRPRFHCAVALGHGAKEARPRAAPSLRRRGRSGTRMFGSSATAALRRRRRHGHRRPLGGRLHSLGLLRTEPADGRSAVPPVVRLQARATSAAARWAQRPAAGCYRHAPVLLACARLSHAHRRPAPPPRPHPRRPSPHSPLPQPQQPRAATRRPQHLSAPASAHPRSAAATGVRTPRAIPQLPPKRAKGRWPATPAAAAQDVQRAVEGRCRQRAVQLAHLRPPSAWGLGGGAGGERLLRPGSRQRRIVRTLLVRAGRRPATAVRRPPCWSSTPHPAASPPVWARPPIRVPSFSSRR